jgi:hypothetical protein
MDRNRPVRRAVAAALCAAGLVAAFPAAPSSHREAPFIATQPQTDGTDFYMFRSYEPGREGFVTMIANYLPLQDGYGGPNYFKLDPTAVYEIHVSNDGGARENLTFQFRFQQQLANNALTVGGKQVAIPLVQNGSKDVSEPGSTALNVTETYTVDVIRGLRRAGTVSHATNGATGSTVFAKPVDYIGQKTISNYVAYANGHIWPIAVPGCAQNGRVFVGQRKDPFVVNLGETFDLVNIKYPAVELNPLAEFASVDSLGDKNVTSIVLEMPIACLTEGKGDIVGAWTTASVPMNRSVIAAPAPGLDGASAASGELVQVSRLGMPLVNEVVIGLKDKNRFNASEPKDDGQFADYVTNPTLPALLEILFGAAGVKAPTNFPRTDLVAAFLTGIDGSTSTPTSSCPRCCGSTRRSRRRARASRADSACSAATPPASRTAGVPPTTSSTSSSAWRWACCARSTSAAARRPTRPRAGCTTPTARTSRTRSSPRTSRTCARRSRARRTTTTRSRSAVRASDSNVRPPRRRGDVGLGAVRRARPGRAGDPSVRRRGARAPARVA